MAVAYLGSDEDPGSLSDEQSDLLVSGVRIIRECPWPCDPSVRVGMHALSRADVVEALAQARLDVKLYQGEVVGDKGKPEPPDAQIVEKLFRDQVVQRAFCGPPRKAGEPGAQPFRADVPIFNSVEDLRDSFSEAEIELLYQMYATWEQQVSPLMRAEFVGNQELFDQILGELKKKAPDEPSLLSVLPRTTLQALLTYSVSLLPVT